MLYDFEDVIFCNVKTPHTKVIYEDPLEASERYLKCIPRPSISLINFTDMYRKPIPQQYIFYHNKLLVTESCKLFYSTGFRFYTKSTFQTLRINHILHNSKVDSKIKLILYRLGLCEDVSNLILEYLGSNYVLEPYVIKAGKFEYIKNGYEWITKREFKTKDERFVFGLVIPTYILAKVKPNFKQLRHTMIKETGKDDLAFIGISKGNFNLNYVVGHWRRNFW